MDSKSSRYLNKETGCPSCSSRKNENIIFNIIKNNNIDIKRHQLLSSIIKNETEKRIIVDFYINNIIIEYNGTQHYRPVCFGGIEKEIAEFNFIKQQARDQYLQSFAIKIILH